MLEALKLTGIGMTSPRTRERLVGRLRDKGIENEEVLEVIKHLPRHIFVDEALSHQAYDDNALPIGYGQTISQPWVVARMTELLIEPKMPASVLEIGTGCGYQTAVLAALGTKVFSVERIKPLQAFAKQRLRELRLINVQFKHADGGFGWPNMGPFDAIIAACSPREIPEELLQQLAPSGRLVMPVGEQEQWLTVVDREEDEFKYQTMERVRFVPFQRGVE